MLRIEASSGDQIRRWSSGEIRAERIFVGVELGQGVNKHATTRQLGIRFDDEGLYSERIFGPAETWVNPSTGFQPLGHIELAAPVLHPLWYQSKCKKNYLASPTLQQIEEPPPLLLDVLPVLSPAIRRRGTAWLSSPAVKDENWILCDLDLLYLEVIRANHAVRDHLQRRQQSRGSTQVEPTVPIAHLNKVIDELFFNRPVVTYGKSQTAVRRRPDGTRLSSMADNLHRTAREIREQDLIGWPGNAGTFPLVPNPHLKTGECILPRNSMMQNLFRPILDAIRTEGSPDPQLMDSNWIDDSSRWWESLQAELPRCPVLLTQQSSQCRTDWVALQPIRIDGEAVQVNPTVLQMLKSSHNNNVTVLVPISKQARSEALNLIQPEQWYDRKCGDRAWEPTTEVVVGCFHLTSTDFNLETCLADNTMKFASVQDVLTAYDHGVVQLRTPVEVRVSGPVARQNFCHEWEVETLVHPQRILTTVGRVLLNDQLSSSLPFYNGSLDKRRLGKILDACVTQLGIPAALCVYSRIEKLAHNVLTLSGLSIGLSDLQSPLSKSDLLMRADSECQKHQHNYFRGLIAPSERYFRIVETWASMEARMEQDIADYTTSNRNEAATTSSHELPAIMASSGCVDRRQLRRLAGMIGRSEDRFGYFREIPICSSWAEGLNVNEYWFVVDAARRTVAGDLERKQAADSLVHLLVKGLRPIRIVDKDCGTANCIEKSLAPGMKRGEQVESFGFHNDIDTIVGRVSAETIVNPLTDETIVQCGELVTLQIANQFAHAGVAKIGLRSPIHCEADGGICQACYGVDLITGQLVELETPVGLHAARSMAMNVQPAIRWYPISRPDTVQYCPPHAARPSGRIRYDRIRFVTRKDGVHIALNDDGQLTICGYRSGVEVELAAYRIRYGAELFVSDGDTVLSRQRLFDWNEGYRPIVAEVSGRIRFDDIVQGITCRSTGSSEWSPVRMLRYSHPYRPRITLVGEREEVRACYYLPEHAVLRVDDGAQVDAGSTLAELKRTAWWDYRWLDDQGMKRLLCGLPPAEPCALAPISGTIVSYRRQGDRRIIAIQADASEEIFEVATHSAKALCFGVGDRVHYGDQLSEGPAAPQEVLDIVGATATVDWLIDQLRQRFSGDDRYLELTIRRMLSQWQVVSSDHPKYVKGQIVDHRPPGVFVKRVISGLKHCGDPSVKTRVLNWSRSHDLSRLIEVAWSHASFPIRCLADQIWFEKLDGCPVP